VKAVFTVALVAGLVALALVATADEPVSLEAATSMVGLRPAELEVGASPDWLGSSGAAPVAHLMPFLAELWREPGQLPALGERLLLATRSARQPGRGRGPLVGVLATFGLQPRHPRLLAPRRDDGGEWAAPGALTAALGQLRELAEAGATASGECQPMAAELPPAGPEELGLDPALRGPLARLLVALACAAQDVRRSWREVPPEVLRSATASSGVARLLAAGQTWWPEVESAAREGDDRERAVAALIVAAAVQHAVPELQAAAARLSGPLRWEAATPGGRVVVAGLGRDQHRCAGDCLLLVDLGGDDLWLGTTGAAIAPAQVVSVAIDLAGNDRYLQAGAAAAQGAGVGGVGLLVDVAGNDRYQARDQAQGTGFLGYGLLWEGGGDDRYLAEGTAQGAALFGAGLVLEQSGDDAYGVHGEGQGFGGPWGCGALVDLDGDDSYRAEPDPSQAGRADYHSGGRVATNNAQGAGVGRRGDLGDGHLWAGGLGVLADLAGDDAYTAGNFAQGMGYFFGTGLLLDGAGDDAYSSVYFTQAASLHFGAGLLLDLAGNDQHWLEGKAGASLGYAWDFALAALVDGSGDDLYRLVGAGLGCADRRSLAMVLELGGCDTYHLEEGARGLGAVDDRPPRAGGGEGFQAGADAPQVGLFLDLGGDDLYQVGRGFGAEPRDASLWVWPDCGGGWRGRNVGAGLDLTSEPPESAARWMAAERGPSGSR